mgnify:CR=1 FL=1
MNKIKKFILFFILGLSIISCRNNSNENHNSKLDGSKNIDTTLTCTLKENIDVIQNIEDAKFLNDSVFFVITNKQIIKYNILGEQIQVFSNRGHGPHEYITPSIIDINNSSIYVWCNTSMKLIEYSHDGEYKRAITNYKEAIKNFKVYKDKYILFYKSNGIKQGIIDIHDMEKDEKIKSVGIFSDEDLILSMVKFKPEIIIRDDYVYFIRPSTLNLYRFKIGVFDVEETEGVYDDSYHIEKVDDAKHLIKNQRMKAFEYIYNNSMTDNIFLIKGGLVIKSETGKYYPNERKKILDRNRRFNKFYFYSFSKLKNEDFTWESNVSFNSLNYLNYKDDLYVIENTLNNETEQSKLYKINFLSK